MCIFVRAYMQVCSLSLLPFWLWFFIVFTLFFLCVFSFFLFWSLLVCLLRGFRRNAHTCIHTIWVRRVTSEACQSCCVVTQAYSQCLMLFHMLFKWYLFSSLLSVPSSHWLLGKQWSHRHRWRTKRTDRIRHSVQPKWPGTSSDQTDLLQLHSSSSL